MKIKRIISILLSALLVVSCAIGTVNADDNTETNYNTYQQMLEFIKPENNYGLEDTVNDGKILQAWNWSYNNIIDNLELVAEQGFTTIQVSPPNEIKMPTKDVTVITEDNSNGWWMFYQPAGFQLNEDPYNALGTKDDFVKMCEEANNYGIKIIVDAVINHMGTDDDHTGEEYNNTSVDPMDHVNSRAWEFEQDILNAKAFHSPWINCTYVENLKDNVPQYHPDGSPVIDEYGNHVKDGQATEEDIVKSITRHCTSGLPDLDTSQKVVQDAIYEYFVELIEAGASGFRIDAAKHIETSKDMEGYASDFWENTLLKIRENYPDKEIYAYGEILNKCGDGRPFQWYTCMMDVTDSVSYGDIKKAVTSNGSFGNATPVYPNDNFTKETVIQWNESHDTYMDGSTSDLTVEQRNKIWAATAAREGITGVYFARPTDEPASNVNKVNELCSTIKLGDANKTSWTDDTVRAVNQFDNFYGDATEKYFTLDKLSVITRGNTGATLINLNGTECNITENIYNLVVGTYTDAISGNTFTVSKNGKLTGNIGSTGIAVIYYSEDKPHELPDSPIKDVYPTKNGFYTIVFENTLDWSNVYMYSWNEETQKFDDKKLGTPMKYGQLSAKGKEEYYGYISKKNNRIVFNQGGTLRSEIITFDVAQHTGYSLNEDLSVTAFHAHTTDALVTIPAVDATCTETGLTEGKKCCVTDEVIIPQEATPLKEHSYTGAVTKKATCTEEGVKTFTCVCGDSYTEVIKATGHKHTSKVTKKATCTQEGVMTYTCACGNTYTKKIAKTTHVTTKSTKKATYFAGGYKNRVTCKVCKKLISKGTTLKKLTLKTPKVKYTAGKKKLTVKYTKVSGATGFQVKYKIGKKTVTKTYSTKKSVSKTIKSLKKGTYKVQIRAFVKSGSKKAYSSWTKAKTVKVK